MKLVLTFLKTHYILHYILPGQKKKSHCLELNKQDITRS